MSSQSGGPTPRQQILERITELEGSLALLRRELLNIQSDAGGTFDALGFVIHEKTYAVFLSDVVEVLRMVKLMPLPKAPPDIPGIINCRGSVLPVLNPGAILADRPLDASISNALVVVSASGQNIGLLVDHVVGVQTYLNKHLGLVSEAQAVHHTLPPYLVGFIKTPEGHVSLVDVNQLLGIEDKRVLGTALRERDEWGRV